MGLAKNFYKLSEGNLINVYHHVGIYSFNYDKIMILDDNTQNDEVWKKLVFSTYHILKEKPKSKIQEKYYPGTVESLTVLMDWCLWSY